MISINKRAMVLVREILDNSEVLQVHPLRMACGATCIDMGIESQGTWEAGKLFTRITLGDLGKFWFGKFDFNTGHSLASVELFVDQPLIACLGSQIAGWKLGEGEYATIGSGPARAQAAVPRDPYLDMTPYRDRNDEVVLCLQDTKVPKDSIAETVAKECKVDIRNVYLLVAPSASIVGSIQVSGRMIEQVCHKMHEKGFDVGKIVSARGSAPVAPLVENELEAMGRINDALLYGADGEFWVRSTDEEIQSVIHKLVSCSSSPEYGKCFKTIFEEAGKDFYHIDHDVHSTAKIQIHNVITGSSFTAGEIAYDLLTQSLLKQT